MLLTFPNPTAADVKASESVGVIVGVATVPVIPVELVNTKLVTVPLPPAASCHVATPEASVVNTLSASAPIVILNPAVVKFPPIIKFPVFVCSVEPTFIGAGRLELN